MGREAEGNPVFGTFTPLEGVSLPSADLIFSEHIDQSLRPTALWKKTGIVHAGESGPGCAVGCIYCNQISLDKNTNGDKIAGYLSCGVDGGISVNSRLMVGNKIDQEIAADDLINAIGQYPYYETSSSVILENFNDPGMDWGKTVEIMKRMVTELQHTGPILFITKMGITPNYAEQIRKVKEMGGRPICIVTYSGMPQEIEPINGKARLKTMEQMHNAGIPVIVSMRPMITGINATEGKIKETIHDTQQFADISTVGGLFVYRGVTAEAFSKAGYPLPPEYTAIDYPVAKILPDGIKKLVRQVASDMGISTPVHNNTSCAVSQLMTLKYHQPTPDRLAHWSGDTKPKFESVCSAYCHRDQLAVCKEKSEESPQKVAELAKRKLERMGYPDYRVIPSVTQAGLLLVEGNYKRPGSFLIEQLFAVSESSGWYVNNLPSYEGLVHRSRQAIEEDMGLTDFNSIFAGAILVGQEWHVFVDGTIDQWNNELAARWLRSRNRARIQVENARQLLSPAGFEEIKKRFMKSSQEAGQLQTEKELSEQLFDLLRKMQVYHLQESSR